MRWFTKAHRPGRSGVVLRTRLSLESLDARLAPSSLYGDAPSPPETTSADWTGDAPPRGAPQIAGFCVYQTGPGEYMFVGQVEGLPDCSGLTVTFDGVPALAGRTATTTSDGVFMLQVVIPSGGGNVGTVTAQTTAGGISSNVAELYFNPTA